MDEKPRKKYRAQQHLTTKQLVEVFALVEGGVPVTQIAKKFNTYPQVITHACKKVGIYTGRGRAYKAAFDEYQKQKAKA